MKYEYMVVARKYAQAFLNAFSSPLDAAIIDSVDQASIFLQNNKTSSFIGTLPSSFDAIKKNLVDQVIKKYHLPADIYSLGNLLIQHHRLFLFSYVLKYIAQLYRDQHTIIICSIYSSYALTDTQKKQITKFVEAKIGKKVIVKEYSDPSLIAGIRILVDGSEWEYSIAKQLRDAQRTWRYE